MDDKEGSKASQQGADYAVEIFDTYIAFAEARGLDTAKDHIQFWAGLMGGLTGSMTALLGPDVATIVVERMQGLPASVSQGPSLRLVKGEGADQDG